MAEEKKTLRQRYSSVSGTISTVQSAVSLFKDFRNKYDETFKYTAVLDESAFIYPEIMRYINTKTKTRNFKFHSTREGVIRFYDSENSTTFHVDGHKIKVTLSRSGPKRSSDDFTQALESMATIGRKDQLIFTCNTAEGLHALESLLKKFTDEKQAQKKINYIVNPDKWGDWDYETLPEKSLDSIFLPEGVLEDLVSDIETFLSKESRFKHLGIPYHRGYALYGKPGNGKSSLALGLANHFNMDLYNLPLSTVKEDKELNRAIASLRGNSILLLEDIDIFSNTMNREGSADSPTLAGLLNALDGVSTPNGLITIMTTNHFERLDPALVRPGRMDYKIELKAPVAYQVEKMFLKVFEEPLGIEPKQFGSMAEVADVFKRNLDDPEAVRLELKND